jgi:hypothetical protein
MDWVRDVVTGEDHDIAHLRPEIMSFHLMVDGRGLEVPLHVYYSNHCFTRSRVEGDPDAAVLFRETSRQGRVDERVFCPKRYRFSLGLPDLVSSLGQAMCFRGGSGEIFYRVRTDPTARQRTHGWYVCGRLDASAKHRELRLNIRSVHYRTNEPSDVRGQARFFQILQPFYEAQKAKYDWL